MKYIVELGYQNTYEFETPSTAIDFAELAFAHRVENRSFDYITLRVKGDEIEEVDHETD